MLLMCSECGNRVSDKAVSCPHCGCPINVIIHNAEIIKPESNPNEALKTKDPTNLTVVNDHNEEKRECGRKKKRVLRIPLLCLIPTVVLAGSFIVFVSIGTVCDLRTSHTDYAGLGFMWAAVFVCLHMSIRILQGYSWPRLWILIIGVAVLLPSITKPAILFVMLMWVMLCMPFWIADTVCKWFVARKRLRFRKTSYHIVTRTALLIEVVGFVCFLYWLSHPERYIKAPSDDRQGSHPGLFGVHLRDEIKSRIDMPSGFVVTNTSAFRCFYPEVIWKGVPKDILIQGVKRYEIHVSKLNSQVESIFLEKEYFESNTSAVWRDYQALTDYVNTNFKGTMKDEERDGRWKRSWDFGYGQSLKIEFTGLHYRSSSFLRLDLRDDGLIRDMIRVGVQRGITNPTLRP